MSNLTAFRAGELTQDQVERVERYARASRAPSTLAGYKKAMRRFQAWCDTQGRTAIPADAATMAAFLADAAGSYRPSSLNVFVSAIAYAHRLAGHPFDWHAFAPVLAGIRRHHGIAPKQVAAITVGELRRTCASLQNTLRGKRDRALLLIGFAGALRRSELVGLDIGDTDPSQPGTGLVELSADGARITLHRTKTDQEGKGVVKGIPRGADLDPVEALEDWLAIANIDNGPIFRPIDKGGRIGTGRLTDRSVAEIVKRAVYRASLASGSSRDDAEARAARVAGHSLRAGFATSAAAAEVTGENIARHVGWTTSQMAQRYIREADLFRKNPLRRVLG